jgi:mono/diheme cytochrome c family protein
VPRKDEVARGRYLVQVAGCNDCHTPGYGPKEGKVDEKLWLTGDALGWSGPWGTTYATNLRLHAQRHVARPVDHAREDDEAAPAHAVVQRARHERGRPGRHPRLHARARPGRLAAPSYVPPGQKPAGPVVRFPD